jgi:hypothetical protein
MKSNIKFFFWGVVAALGALVLETLISIINPAIISPSFEAQLGVTLVVLVLVEEIFKFIFIWKMAGQTPEKVRIFFHAFLVGLGFAAAEIVLNILGYPYFSFFLLSVYLGLLLVHTVTAAIYGQAFFLRGPGFRKTWSFFLAGAALHLLFNAAVIYGINYWLLDGILIIIGGFLFLKNHRMTQQ